VAQARRQVFGRAGFLTVRNDGSPYVKHKAFGKPC